MPREGGLAGWLLKRSDGKLSDGKLGASFGNLVKQWNRRHFRLNLGTLSYSRTEMEASTETTVDSFQLNDCSVAAGPTAAELLLFSRSRVLHLCAASPEDAHMWRVALRAAGAARSVNEPVARPPAVAESSVLESIATNLATPVEWCSADHQQALLGVWQALRLADGLDELAGIEVAAGSDGKRAFARDSAGWKLAGFQRGDPCSDFRGAGTVGLAFLAWLVEKDPHAACTAIAWQQWLRAESDNECGLPWAAAVLNCVRLVADVLGVSSAGSSPGCSSCAAPYARRCWNLVASMETFFEVVLVALEWVQRDFEARGARYMDFNASMRQLRVLMDCRLGSHATFGCGSHVELRHALHLPAPMATSGHRPTATSMPSTQSETPRDESLASKRRGSGWGSSGRGSVLSVWSGWRQSTTSESSNHIAQERTSCPRDLVLGHVGLGQGQGPAISAEERAARHAKVVSVALAA